MRLLCVEDEVALREDIAEFLRMKSYDVDEASNGQEAIDQLSRNRYDLVLCDIKMPNMDGYDLLQEVRRDNHLTATPFVFLTALNENGDKVRAHGSGCDVFLTKPIDFSVLETMLKAQIDRQRVRDYIASNTLDSTRNHAMTALEDALHGPVGRVEHTVQHLRDILPSLSPAEIDTHLSEIQEAVGKHALNLHVLNTTLQFQITHQQPERQIVNAQDLIKGAVGAHHFNTLASTGRVPQIALQNLTVELDVPMAQRAIAELLAAIPAAYYGQEAVDFKLVDERGVLTIADDMAMLGDEDFERVDETTNLPLLSHVARQRLVPLMFAMQVAHAHHGRMELKNWPEDKLAVRLILPRPLKH